MHYRWLAPVLALTLMLAAAPCPRSARAQEAAEAVPAPAGTESPQAQGHPGARDEVENWIDQNMDADERQETVAAPEAAPAAGLTREADLGRIDWGTGEITALGRADAPGDAVNPARAEALAVRKATLDARKQLQDLVFGLALDGRHVAGEELDARVRAELRGKLQNSPIERGTEPDDAGGVRVEVRARASLRGDLAAALIPAAVSFDSRIAPTIPLDAPVADGAAPDVDQQQYRQSMAELGGFTGLLVDARGFDAAPALLPVVVDPQGKAAFGPYLAPRDLVLSQGLAVYAHSPQDPAARNRVGGTPLVVRAIAVSGPQRADIVISGQDAELVRMIFRAGDLRGRCPVAIIMD